MIRNVEYFADILFYFFLRYCVINPKPKVYNTCDFTMVLGCLNITMYMVGVWHHFDVPLDTQVIKWWSIKGLCFTGLLFNFLNSVISEISYNIQRSTYKKWNNLKKIESEVVRVSTWGVYLLVIWIPCAI